MPVWGAKHKKDKNFCTWFVIFHMKKQKYGGKKFFIE